MTKAFKKERGEKEQETNEQQLEQLGILSSCTTKTPLTIQDKWSLNEWKRSIRGGETNIWEPKKMNNETTTPNVGLWVLCRQEQIRTNSPKSRKRDTIYAQYIYKHDTVEMGEKGALPAEKVTFQRQKEWAIKAIEQLRHQMKFVNTNSELHPNHTTDAAYMYSSNTSIMVLIWWKSDHCTLRKGIVNENPKGPSGKSFCWQSKCCLRKTSPNTRHRYTIHPR